MRTECSQPGTTSQSPIPFLSLAPLTLDSQKALFVKNVEESEVWYAETGFPIDGKRMTRNL